MAQERGNLYIVTEDYPPYEMAEPVDGLQGLDYEVVTEVFETLGYTPKISFLPWKRALREAQLGRTLGILTCAYKKDREDFIVFSDPISEFTNGFYTRKDFSGPKPETIEDVRNERVASISAYESLSILQSLGLNPIEVQTTKNAILMLDAKRFDYLYVNGESTDFTIKQVGLADKFDFYPIKKKNFYFCFSKKFPGVKKIIKEFRHALITLKESGKFESIHAKYR